VREAQRRKCTKQEEGQAASVTPAAAEWGAPQGVSRATCTFPPGVERFPSREVGLSLL
jgi:hypothetical protein